jgi:hypothetical protein
MIYFDLLTSKYVYCTTGPSLLTAAARKVVFQCSDRGNGIKKVKHIDNRQLSNRCSGISYRLASTDFRAEGGKFKAVRVRYKTSNAEHYTQVSGKRGEQAPTFLEQYATEDVQTAAVQDFINSHNGWLLKGRSERRVFYIEAGRRRPVGGLDIFRINNFTFEDIIHVSDKVVDSIPIGSPLTGLVSIATGNGPAAGL